MLTKPQIESEQMKDLKYDLKIKNGIIIYTASTMREQRYIAEYINSIDGKDYEILDFSQKETHPMKKSLYTDSSKVIITNMQEIVFAPYCKTDNKATVTLEDKIEWCNRNITDELRRNEGTILQSINVLRDSFFRDRKVICGMHPNFLDKMEYMPYFDYIDDWLDYVIDKVRFNTSPEFTQSLPLSTSSNNSNEIQAGDMVFVFKNRVIRCPDFDSFKKYTEAERIEKLSQLPEISFPLKNSKDMDKGNGGNYEWEIC